MEKILNNLFILIVCNILCSSLFSIQPAIAAASSPFPTAQSTVLPNPAAFFAPNLLSSPLPTNSFFQNFVLNNGDSPEYFHPYSIKSSSSSLSLHYPSFNYTSSSISQSFVADLTISSASSNDSNRHIISAFHDLSVTLDFPSSNLRFFLVRGSPYITCHVSKPTSLSLSTNHTILSSSSSRSNTKYTLKLNNDQTWLVYTSSPIQLVQGLSSKVTFSAFSGTIRLAVLPDSDSKSEKTLDRFSYCFPISGAGVFTQHTLGYKFEKYGPGSLLMLAHPLHLRLLPNNATILDYFKYKSIDGDLVGVVGDTWELKPEPTPITWPSIGGIKQDSLSEIISALRGDVQALNSASITTKSSYFYGKLIARAARLALIAEEVHCPDVIPWIKKFLSETIQPWLEGSFSGNGFLYDGKWGGLVTQQGSTDKGADFGFGIYNDHHFHLGYFVYGISVLAKIDPAWGTKYRTQAYALVEDFINEGKQSNPSYPRLRNFDFYKLHSWAGGLTEFMDGRNQESTSEAINGYYAAALMGKAYRDTHLESTGSLLTALEIQAAKMWWHVNKGENKLYGDDFTGENRIVGIVWATKRDSGLWFAPADAREIRLGIQTLPISPITQVVFDNVDYVRELVGWTSPEKEGVTDGWKGFVYALQGIYDQEGALGKIRSLKEFDDGNSLTNMLWWMNTRH